jgi:DNA-nicking Smr family endonuclease
MAAGRAGLRGAMDDPREPPASAEELLARALPGIEPLDREERERVIEPRRRPGRRRPAAAGAAPAPPFAVERYGEVVAALARGADPRWLDRLRGGRVAPDAELDLHGHTAASAAVALAAAVARAAADRRRCLRVVHGRGLRSPGGPVLKEEVIARLTAPPLAGRVVAFATAPPDRGGGGALLVLLRGPRGGESRRR